MRRQHGEYDTQCAFMQWLFYFDRKIYKLTYAIPNGGKRTPSEGAHNKRLGLKSGVPDIHVAYPFNGFPGLYIEFKHGKNKTTLSQDEMIVRLRSVGYRVEICYSFDEARAVLLNYLTREDAIPLMRQVNQPNPKRVKNVNYKKMFKAVEIGRLDCDLPRLS